VNASGRAETQSSGLLIRGFHKELSQAVKLGKGIFESYACRATQLGCKQVVVFRSACSYCPCEHPGDLMPGGQRVGVVGAEDLQARVRRFVQLDRPRRSR
jgi:hypothetical protein